VTGTSIASASGVKKTLLLVTDQGVDMQFEGKVALVAGANRAIAAATALRADLICGIEPSQIDYRDSSSDEWAECPRQ
jgi:hypothetical protein